MELSNFKLISIIGSDPVSWKFKGTVDVTVSKFIFWKVTEELEIFKSFGEFWYFTHTGIIVPVVEVERLVNILKAEKGKDLEYCLD